MKILTVGESPYLLSKSGKIHADVIRELKKNGHEINSAVWNFDITWFSGNEKGKYYYEDEDEEICELHPFIPHPDQTSPHLYEVMKKFEPDIIVSVTEHDDIISSGLFAVCGLSPGKFKWIGVFLIEALPLNEKFVELFSVVDSGIFTTKASFDAVKKDNEHLDCYYVPYGPDHDKFFDSSHEEDGTGSKLRLMSCSKNSQVSNIPALLISTGQLDSRLYFNTNHSDVGEYDLEVLIRRYGCGNVVLPDKFVSLNDGLTSEELNKKYNDSDIIIDVSVRSATALSVLEGMATGCIPVVTKIGALKEIIEKLPKEYQFFVRSNIYVGDHEKEYQIVSVDSMVEQLKKIKKIKDENKEEFEKIRRIVKEMTLDYTNKVLPKKVVELVEEKRKNHGTIGVDVI